MNQIIDIGDNRFDEIARYVKISVVDGKPVMEFTIESDIKDIPDKIQFSTYRTTSPTLLLSAWFEEVYEWSYENKPTTLFGFDALKNFAEENNKAEEIFKLRNVLHSGKDMNRPNIFYHNMLCGIVNKELRLIYMILLVGLVNDKGIIKDSGVPIFQERVDYVCQSILHTKVKIVENKEVESK